MEAAGVTGGLGVVIVIVAAVSILFLLATMMTTAIFMGTKLDNVRQNTERIAAALERIGMALEKK